MNISIENNSKMVLEDNQYRRFATAIGLFLGGLAISFLLRKNLLPIAVGLVFAGVGGFLFYTTKRVNIELNKAIGKIKIRLIGFKQTDEREMAFSDIQKIVVRKLIQKSITSTSNRGRTRTGSVRTYYLFRLILVTTQNEELPFDFGTVRAGLANLIVSPDSGKQKAGQQIADFVGVPLEMSLPSAPSPVAVLSAIKEGIAARASR